jgi:hypothetical protein
MDYDRDKVDDMVLALMCLTLHDEAHRDSAYVEGI